MKEVGKICRMKVLKMSVLRNSPQKFQILGYVGRTGGVALSKISRRSTELMITSYV